MPPRANIFPDVTRTHRDPEALRASALGLESGTNCRLGHLSCWRYCSSRRGKVVSCSRHGRLEREMRSKGKRSEAFRLDLPGHRINRDSDELINCLTT